MRVRALAVAAATGIIVSTVAAAPAQAAEGDPFITAVHAIASVDDVDIWVGAAVPDVFDDLEYAGDPGFLQVPSGTVANVSITEFDAASPTPALAGLAGTFTVTGDVSLVAQVNSAGTPKLVAYTDDYSPTPAGKARVILRHVAQAPTVSVETGGTVLAQAISNDSTSTTLTVDAGTYPIVVKAAGVAVPGLSITETFAAGAVYIIYATGDPENGYGLTSVFDDTVGQLPATTAPTTTAAATTAATTTTTRVIPTAVPAGDGSAGWSGPLGVPALLAILLSAGVAVTVGFSMRGSAARR